MKTFIKSVIGSTFFVVTLLFSISSLSADDHIAASLETQEKIKILIANPDRPERHTNRDKYRHPLKTLTFMGIEPGSKVAEIFPGGQGGWYRRIIEPFIKESGGAYYPVSERSDWPAESVENLPYGELDMVFVFRAHGFLIYDEPAQDHVDDIFKMLKPGGYMGIVDHAEREGIEQDPVSKNGYVQESFFKAMAEKAGFKLIKTSDVNRNPKDTKQHPRGVYSLPPTLAGWVGNDKYRAIGESDRFTHIYQKPE
jgi:predicted methyltransferase